MRFLFALSLLLSGCFLASAQLALCGESVNFGIIREADGMKTATAYVKNVSESPVFLLKVKPTCGCTAADFPRESILPGDSACITLTYNPLRRPGRFNKEVKVFPSDGEMIRIPIHGTVIASESTLNQLYPDKAGPLRLSESTLMPLRALTTEPRKMVAGFYNTASEPLAVQVSCDSPAVEVEFYPDIVGAGEKGVIEVTVNPLKEEAKGKKEYNLQLRSAPEGSDIGQALPTELKVLVEIL